MSTAASMLDDISQVQSGMKEQHSVTSIERNISYGSAGMSLNEGEDIIGAVIVPSNPSSCRTEGATSPGIESLESSQLSIHPSMINSSTLELAETLANQGDMPSEASEEKIETDEKILFSIEKEQNGLDSAFRLGKKKDGSTESSCDCSNGTHRHVVKEVKASDPSEQENTLPEGKAVDGDLQAHSVHSFLNIGEKMFASSCNSESPPMTKTTTEPMATAKNPETKYRYSFYRGIAVIAIALASFVAGQRNASQNLTRNDIPIVEAPADELENSAEEAPYSFVMLDAKYDADVVLRQKNVSHHVADDDDNHVEKDPHNKTQPNEATGIITQNLPSLLSENKVLQQATLIEGCTSIEAHGETFSSDASDMGWLSYTRTIDLFFFAFFILGVSYLCAVRGRIEKNDKMNTNNDGICADQSQKVIQLTAAQQYIASTPTDIQTTSEKSSGRWTKEEHKQFLKGFTLHGRHWRHVVKHVPTRTLKQVQNHGFNYLRGLEKGVVKKEPFAEK